VDTGTFCSGECDTLLRKFLGSLELMAVWPAGGLDSDQDGVTDAEDNCPNVRNPMQEDTDSNGTGDACNSHEDHDDDDWANDLDNCPVQPNPTQKDTDSNGRGDACNNHYDEDGDEWENNLDNCYYTPNPMQEDSDGDGYGDACPQPTHFCYHLDAWGNEPGEDPDVFFDDNEAWKAWLRNQFFGCDVAAASTQWWSRNNSTGEESWSDYPDNPGTRCHERGYNMSHWPYCEGQHIIPLLPMGSHGLLCPNGNRFDRDFCDRFGDTCDRNDPCGLRP
jgi:hypothetical protein